MALASTCPCNVSSAAAPRGLHAFSSRLAPSSATSAALLLKSGQSTQAPRALLPQGARSAQPCQAQIRQDATGAAPPPAGVALDNAAYTSMRSDPLGFWEAHPGLLRDNASPGRDDHSTGSSLLDEEEATTLFLAAELQLLANAASDRAEMHSILAVQRDNWNKLFQRMLTAATMTACMLSGLNGAQPHPSLSLGLPALLLSAGSAAMMAVINQFQPSQLAEEQRTATRLFRKLAGDIHYSLHVAPHLRQNTPSFLRDCKRRMQALDKAFPMPLTPGGLEKFPAKVVPPVLIEPAESSPSSTSSHIEELLHSPSLSPEINQSNRHDWSAAQIADLQSVATLLDRSDIRKYTGWAQNLVKVNKCLAVAAPLLAALAALLNALVISTAALPNLLATWAAVSSVLAAFASSFSNDMQLGMVFELYRNSAGYYMDVKTSIDETLRMPIDQRENGTLFRHRIAYQLGRSPSTDSTWKSSPLVPPDAEEAGTLF